MQEDLPSFASATAWAEVASEKKPPPQSAHYVAQLSALSKIARPLDEERVLEFQHSQGPAGRVWTLSTFAAPRDEERVLKCQHSQDPATLAAQRMFSYA